MTLTSHPLLRWTPRILGLAMAVFVGLFAFDAFGPDKPLAQALGDFALHLVPSAVLVGIVLLSFRWPLIGAVGFIALAAGYTYFARHHLSWILIVSWPLLVIGVLFLLSWMSQNEARRA